MKSALWYATKMAERGCDSIEITPSVFVVVQLVVLVVLLAVSLMVLASGVAGRRR